MPQAILAGFLLQRLGFIWVADLFDTPHFGLDLEGDPVGVGRYLSRLYNNLLLSQTRRVVVDADLVLIAMVPEAFESYGIDPDADNVLHVTNGTKVEATRRVWSDREVSSFRVLYIGPVRRARGLDILIDALESLEGTVDDVELRLVGPIHDATWLMNELDKLADVIVTILGQVPHERALQEVDQATVCTCPLSPEVENYHYSYPIKVFEYMALGKPIVATRMQGTSEILEDGRTGLLVPPDDSKALANAIQTLARDQQLRQKLSANASESVKKYDWEQINDRIFERIQVVSS
jgi:glycosyltransferase involved in cell wall biosynthesis